MWFRCKHEFKIKLPIDVKKEVHPYILGNGLYDQDGSPIKVTELELAVYWCTSCKCLVGVGG